MSAAAGLEARVHVDLGALELRVDLHVPAGETVAVLGPNGAGKTTLLRAIAGLHPLTGGSVVLDGTALDGDPSERPVGLVFQDHRLFPHLSVLENVAFGLRCQGRTRAESRSAAQAWLERVHLGDRGHDRPAALSGGEAQRVALARALATGPRVLLLDEPLSALDATTRASVRRDLRAFLDAHEGVRLLVTHDPLEAMALADRLVILEEGRIVQQGTAAEIVARPRSPYAAALVGVNLLEGSIDAADAGDGSAVRIGAIVVRAAGPPVDGASGPVFAVVHPRSVALHRSPPEGSARNVWPGEAESVDVEGDRARVRVRLSPGASGVVIVAEVTMAASDALQLEAGGQVWASVKATEVSVFPR